MAFRRKWLGIGSAAVAAVAVALAFFPFGGEEARQVARLEAAAETRYAAALPQAEAGDAEAQFMVAEALRRGAGVTRDLDRAVRWYRKAADKGQVGAQYALGTLYEKGEGVPRDYARAAEWYRLAANLGHHAGAEFALAQLYYNGRGLPSDPDEALTWYRRAANGGNPAAQYVLATILESGWNVRVDLVEAYKWLTLALPGRQEAMAVDPQFDPEAARVRLKARMTDFQIMRGEQAAAQWRPAKTPQGLGRDGLSLLGKPAAGPAPDAARPPRVAVRLYSFDLPAHPGTTEPTPVSLVVETADPAEKAWACGMVPRIRDAVTQALWRSPLPGQAGAALLRAVEERLDGPVNQVLNLTAPRQVFLYPGNRPLDANDVLRTPFAEVGDCVLSAKP